MGGGVEKSTNIPEAQDNKTDLSKLSRRQIEEYIHMALTYRISYKNLSILLNVSEEEIKQAFKQFHEYSVSLYHLELETKNEDEINERYTYVKAYNYLQKRKEILRELHQAKQKQDEEAIILTRTKLREHLALVDDSMVIGTFGKHFSKLTKQEQEALARYRLKYYTPIRKSESIIRRDQRTISKLEENLASTDMIFKEKWERLNDHFKEKHEEIKAERRQNKR